MEERELRRKMQAGELASNNGTVMRTLAIAGSDFKYLKLKSLLLALAGTIVLSPLLLVLAAWVKLDSKGPVFFRQKRVGRDKRLFSILKFRSMYADTPHDVPTHLLQNPEAMITRSGRFLRRTSLDELPQLFNILKGDMSLVGPRPERPQFVEKFKEEIPRYMIKHQVRPGMTGWAQVNGFRGDTSIRSRIEHDLYYIENWSLGLDIKILFLTFFKGFVNKNAY